LGSSGGIPILARAAALAIGLLIGASLDIALFDAVNKGAYRNTLEWVAITVPLLVIFNIPLAPLPGWVWPTATRGRKLRFTGILWLLTGIILPWILAWLVADAIGGWFTNWWRQAHSGGEPGAYLWAVWLIVIVATYVLASATGLMITLLVDRYVVMRHQHGDS